MKWIAGKLSTLAWIAVLGLVVVTLCVYCVPQRLHMSAPMIPRLKTFPKEVLGPTVEEVIEILRQKHGGATVEESVEPAEPE